MGNKTLATTTADICLEKSYELDHFISICAKLEYRELHLLLQILQKYSNAKLSLVVQQEAAHLGELAIEFFPATFDFLNQQIAILLRISKATGQIIKCVLIVGEDRHRVDFGETNLCIMYAKNNSQRRHLDASCHLRDVPQLLHIVDPTAAIAMHKNMNETVHLSCFVLRINQGLALELEHCSAKMEHAPFMYMVQDLGWYYHIEWIKHECYGWKSDKYQLRCYLGSQRVELAAPSLQEMFSHARNSTMLQGYQYIPSQILRVKGRATCDTHRFVENGMICLKQAGIITIDASFTIVISPSKITFTTFGTSLGAFTYFGKNANTCLEAFGIHCPELETMTTNKCCINLQEGFLHMHWNSELISIFALISAEYAEIQLLGSIKHVYQWYNVGALRISRNQLTDVIIIT